MSENAAHQAEDAELRAHVEQALSASYELDQEIGRGGMGIVYLARQDGLDRLVAVKLLAGVNADFALRLRREARVMSELHHPHIVSIYDFGEVSGSPYFAMAYCAGGSVADVLSQQTRLTVGQAVNVLASMSGALSAMHYMAWFTET